MVKKKPVEKKKSKFLPVLREIAQALQESNEIARERNEILKQDMGMEEDSTEEDSEEEEEGEEVEVEDDFE